MSTGLLVFLVLLALAVSYWRRLRRVRAALSLNHLFATGHAFLVIGFLAGTVVGERPVEMTYHLGPIVAYVAGWVGFATGIRFEVPVLRTVPLRAFGVALLPALAASACVAGAAATALLLLGAAPAESFGGALVLAAAAASSGPTLAAILRTRRAGRAHAVRPVLNMIELSAGFDDIVVVVLALLAFALYRPGIEPFSPIVILILALGGAATLGCVTWLFLGGRATEDERMLLGLAMLAFVAGFGSWLHMSPASVTAIAAMVVVNLPGDRSALLVAAIRRVERPAVVILMVLIGYHASGALDWVFLPLVLVMTVLRFAAKGVVGERLSGPGLSVVRGIAARPGWTHGLVPQGTLGLMIALSFFYVWGTPTARSVLAAVAAASVLNEVAAPWLLLRLVRRLTDGAHEPSREAA